jgi:hypothetical protein
MTAADFGNKQVVSNQLNSTISGVITVLQHMYLGRKGNAIILIKNFPSLKNSVVTALHTVHTTLLR